MTENKNGPATAPTVPGHGSISHPQMDTKMNKHLDSTEAAAKPVSRRNFIALAAAGSAALPAVALAEASGKTSRLPQIELSQEEPWTKVRRLARELGEALMQADGGNWYAKVYPKCEARGWSVLYIDIQAENNARFRVEPKLLALIEAHKNAEAVMVETCAAAHERTDGREPTKAAERRWKKACRTETAALAALLRYVPYSDVSRYVKAQYMLPLTSHAQLSDMQMRVLLTSMCGRCA